MKFDFFYQRGPAKLEIWPTQKILVGLKIGVKFEIFDHRGPAKLEIWPNQDISIAFKI